MDALRWMRVRELFEASAELPAGEREAWLAARAEPELLAEVLRLLRADAAAEASFLRPLSRPVQPLHLAEGERIGDFRVVRPVGSGTFSAVYEAVQEQPRRQVALKVLRSASRDPEAQRRFQLEAQVLAHLRHPAIANVLSAGVHAGEGEERWPWIAMEFVAGAAPIDVYARREGIDLEALLRLFLEVCEAVHHGHQKGVIHRDLKPANVLVDARGRPKVIDFGLARVVEGELAPPTLATRAGEVLGTLPYMAPEQFGSQPGDVDVRSDVYALGAILYELLAGRRPVEIDAGNIVSAARAAAEAVPPRLSAVRGGLPSELDWILARCLEKRREDRYPSVSALAEDLERMLAHEPVLAGPPSAVYRLRKLARRHRMALGALCAVVLSLLLGLVLTWRAKVDAERLRALAEARGVALSLEVEKLREVQALIEGALQVADPMLGGGHDMPVSRFLDRLAADLERAQGRPPDVEAAIRRTLGVTYANLGHAERSGQQFRAIEALLPRLAQPEAFDPWLLGFYHARALLLSADLPGVAEKLAELSPGARLRSHADQARLELLRAAQLAAEGRDAEGGPAAQRALELARTAEPHAPEVLGSALLSLARVELSSQRLAEAEALLSELIELAGADPGVPHFTLLIAKGQLGQSLLAGGELEEAREVLEAVLREVREQLGSPHGIEVSTLNLLAQVHVRGGDHGLAQELLRDGIAKARVLGVSHQGDAVDLEIELLRSLTAQRRYAEALAFVEDCLALRRPFTAATHPRAFDLVRLESRLRFLRGQPARSLERLAELAAELAPRAGAVDAPVLQGATRHAASLAQAGWAPPAAELLERFSRILAERVPDRPALLAEVRLAWVESLLLAGETEASARVAAEALAAGAEELDADDWSVWRLRCHLAICELLAGQRERAVEELRACLERGASSDQLDGRWLEVLAGRWLARALEEEGPEDAEALRRHLLQQPGANPSPWFWEGVHVCRELAGALRSQGRAAEALAIAQAAVAGARSAHAHAHPHAHRAHAELELARCLLAAERGEEAGELLRAATEALAGEGAAGSAELARLREEFVLLLEASGVGD